MMLTLFPLWAALISNISAQLIKPFVYYFRTGKFDIQYTVACGGFPSSHTSTVSALSLAVGLVEGFESTLFAVTCIFSLIVIYDAVNVRYYAGKGIQLTKQLISDLEDVMSLKLDDPIYFEKIIIKRDYDKMISAKTKAEKIAKLKKDIESRKKYLAQSIKSINSQQRNLQYAINQNQSMINKLKTNRAYYEKTERELAKQSENLQNMISKTGSSSTVKTSSTGFMKPIGGRITSPFGWRTHPIFNSRTFHSGVDIGGPYRGNIVASNSGKVIYAGWYGGYGKVVILDHGVVNGSPITTLYAHMDSIKVKVGDYVNKGQVVGYEGTTGYSTGPHCHFEVRVNGKPNNPLNYI